MMGFSVELLLPESKLTMPHHFFKVSDLFPACCDIVSLLISQFEEMSTALVSFVLVSFLLKCQVVGCPHLALELSLFRGCDSALIVKPNLIPWLSRSDLAWYECSDGVL